MTTSEGDYSINSTVELLVYDLSNGMAKNLSMAMTGKYIAGIWHTSVIVYGKEYAFGQGIGRKVNIRYDPILIINIIYYSFEYSLILFDTVSIYRIVSYRTSNRHQRYHQVRYSNKLSAVLEIFELNQQHHYGKPVERIPMGRTEITLDLWLEYVEEMKSIWKPEKVKININ